MVRWEPGTLQRLQVAALELFEERGYDATTVADIAARAGLTERTFYRHYTDKREVLVSGSEELANMFGTTIAAQPDDTPPLAAVAAALDVVAEFFDARRAFALRRQAVVASSRDLQERELAKLDALRLTLAEALRARGLPARQADVVAGVGVSIFHASFAAWVSDPAGRSFSTFAHQALDDLRGAVSASVQLS